ncbi:hypothetical protein ACWATR_29860 [Nostoc sp. UIC 10890]
MLSFIVVAIVGTIFGAYLAEFVPANRLQRTFGYFLLALSNGILKLRMKNHTAIA